MTITEPAAAPNSREPLLFVSELEFVASRFIGAAVGELSGCVSTRTDQKIADKQTSRI